MNLLSGCLPAFVFFVPVLSQTRTSIGTFYLKAFKSYQSQLLTIVSIVQPRALNPLPLGKVKVRGVLHSCYAQGL